MKDSLRVAELQTRVLDFFKDRRGKWGVYHSLSHEISLDFLWKKPSKIDWLFPKVQGDQKLKFSSSDDGFEVGYAGIREPRSEVLFEPGELEGLIVPAVAFDKKGYRLGMGQGFYDRVLESYDGETVGISFSDLIQPELPRDSWDCPVQFVITEKGVERF